MKDPAFLFYTGDFISGTMFFTDEQVGMYIRLLMAQHQHGRLSEKQVKIICSSCDKEVLEKFEIDSDGNYYNSRLEKEVNKRKAYSESRSKNRTSKLKEPKKHIKNISKTYDKHMENRDRDINKEKDTTPLGLKLSEFLQYRKEIKKPIVNTSLVAFREKLKKLSKGNEAIAIQILNESMANGWTGIFELKAEQQVVKAKRL